MDVEKKAEKIGKAVTILTEKELVLKEVEAEVEAAVKEDVRRYETVRPLYTTIERIKSFTTNVVEAFLDTVKDFAAWSVVLNDWQYLSVSGELKLGDKYRFELEVDYTHIPWRVTISLEKTVEVLTREALAVRAGCQDPAEKECERRMERALMRWAYNRQEKKSEVGRIGRLQYILEKGIRAVRGSEESRAEEYIKLSFWSPEYHETRWAVKNWKHLAGLTEE